MAPRSHLPRMPSLFLGSQRTLSCAAVPCASQRPNRSVEFRSLHNSGIGPLAPIPTSGERSQGMCSAAVHEHVKLNPVIPGRLRGIDPVAEDLPLVVILHGLLGGANNWRSILSREDCVPGRFVCSVDLRNHGKSPHVATMSYKEMAEDVYQFSKDMEVDHASLIGHSMGGKVAMKLALEHPEHVPSLVVVDIAPVQYNKTFMHSAVLEGMSAVDLPNLSSAQAAREVLTEFIDDAMTLDFVLTNLTLNPRTKQYTWKVNLDALVTGIQSGGLSDFQVREGLVYRGPTLFIRGSESKYIQEDHFDTIRKYFPNFEVATIDGSGHWPHAQKPDEFVDILNDWYTYN